MRHVRAWFVLRWEPGLLAFPTAVGSVGRVVFEAQPPLVSSSSRGAAKGIRVTNMNNDNNNDNDKNKNKNRDESGCTASAPTWHPQVSQPSFRSSILKSLCWSHQGYCTLYTIKTPRWADSGCFALLNNNIIRKNSICLSASVRTKQYCDILYGVVLRLYQGFISSDASPPGLPAIDGAVAARVACGGHGTRVATNETIGERTMYCQRRRRVLYPF